MGQKGPEHTTSPASDPTTPTRFPRSLTSRSSGLGQGCRERRVWSPGADRSREGRARAMLGPTAKEPDETRARTEAPAPTPGRRSPQSAAPAADPAPCPTPLRARRPGLAEVRGVRRAGPGAAGAGAAPPLTPAAAGPAQKLLLLRVPDELLPAALLLGFPAGHGGGSAAAAALRWGVRRARVLRRWRPRPGSPRAAPAAAAAALRVPDARRRGRGRSGRRGRRRRGGGGGRGAAGRLRAPHLRADARPLAGSARSARAPLALRVRARGCGCGCGAPGALARPRLRGPLQSGRAGDGEDGRTDGPRPAPPGAEKLAERKPHLYI